MALTATTATAAETAALQAQSDAWDAAATALLLIDGSPQWIWIAEEDVEILR